MDTEDKGKTHFIIFYHLHLDVLLQVSKRAAERAASKESVSTGRGREKAAEMV